MRAFQLLLPGCPASNREIIPEDKQEHKFFSL
jgi:hypothetical protein